MLSLPMSFLDFPFVLWIHPKAAIRTALSSACWAGSLLLDKSVLWIHPKAAYESYWTIRRPWMEAIKLIVFIQFIHHIPSTGLS